MDAQTSYFLEDELEKYIKEKFRSISEEQFDFIAINPACVYTLKALYTAEFFEDKAREFYEELENIKLDLIGRLG